MGLQRRDSMPHTYADYLSWPDDIRYELIDGIAYLMAPAPSRVHQEFVGELHRQVANALVDQPCRAFVAPFDVRLPKAGEADELVDTVVQPDILVVCDRSKLDERGLRGAPDWVIEVLSPSTAGHDQIRKLAAFERSGVPEVWLVHPIDRVLSVYRLRDGRYQRPDVTELAGMTEVASVPGLHIDWQRVLALLD